MIPTEGLYSCTSVIICCSVVICIIEMVISGSPYEKVLSLILGCFMICSMLPPVWGLIRDIPDLPENEEYTYTQKGDMEKAKKQVIEERISSLVAKTLKEKDICAKDIKTRLEVGEDGTIKNIYAEVTLDKSSRHRAAAAEKLIRSNLSIGCKIS